MRHLLLINRIVRTPDTRTAQFHWSSMCCYDAFVGAHKPFSKFSDALLGIPEFCKSLMLLCNSIYVTNCYNSLHIRACHAPCSGKALKWHCLHIPLSRSGVGPRTLTVARHMQKLDTSACSSRRCCRRCSRRKRCCCRRSGRRTWWGGWCRGCGWGRWAPFVFCALRTETMILRRICQ